MKAGVGKKPILLKLLKGGPNEVRSLDKQSKK